MIRLFLGPDMKTARLAVHSEIEAMGSVSLVRINPENVTSVEWHELAGRSSLFEPKIAIFIDGILDDEVERERVWGALDAMQDSANEFLFLETSMLVGGIKKFEKVGARPKSFGHKEEKKAPTFFSVADALQERNRKRMWIEVVRAIHGGAEPEEVHGILWWAVKNMVLARNAMTAAESGLSPFVFSKAKKGVLQYPGAALDELVDKTARIIFDARFKGEDPAQALERFSLSI